MNTRLMLLSTIFALSVAAGLSADEGHTKDSLETVRKNLAEKKAVILDVRERDEWDEGHLAVAILKPLSRLTGRGVDPAVELKDVDKERIVYCHCRAGVRALTAGKVLKELGYDVRPLKQGYQELVESGFEKAK